MWKSYVLHSSYNPLRPDKCFSVDRASIVIHSTADEERTQRDKVIQYVLRLRIRHCTRLQVVIGTMRQVESVVGAVT